MRASRLHKPYVEKLICFPKCKTFIDIQIKIIKINSGKYKSYIFIFALGAAIASGNTRRIRRGLSANRADTAAPSYLKHNGEDSCARLSTLSGMAGVMPIQALSLSYARSDS